MGDSGQPWLFPREPRQSMMPCEAVSADEIDSFAPVKETWGNSCVFK